MWRLFLPALACSLLMTSSVLATPSLSLEGLPSSFNPGDYFSFDVRLQGAANLNTYNIQILATLDGGTGTAGVDFDFVLPPFDPLNPLGLDALKPSTRYVFEAFSPIGWPANLFTDARQGLLATAGTLGPDTAFINLADVINPFWFPNSADTVSGVNDLVATVTLATSTALTGNLALSIDNAGFLIMQQPPPFGSPTGPDIDGLDDLRADLDDYQQPVTNLIPEPASLMIWSLLGALGIACAWRRRKGNA